MSQTCPTGASVACRVAVGAEEGAVADGEEPLDGAVLDGPTGVGAFAVEVASLEEEEEEEEELACSVKASPALGDFDGAAPAVGNPDGALAASGEIGASVPPGAPARAPAVGDISDANSARAGGELPANVASGAGPIAAPSAMPAANRTAARAPLTRAEGSLRAEIGAVWRGDGGVVSVIA
jgi:hypothetical protein